MLHANEAEPKGNPRGPALGTPYVWRVVPGRLFVDAGAGPVRVSHLIDHAARIVTVAGSIPPRRMSDAVTAALCSLDGLPVKLPASECFAPAGEVAHG